MQTYHEDTKTLEHFLLTEEQCTIQTPMSLFTWSIWSIEYDRPEKSLHTQRSNPSIMQCFRFKGKKVFWKLNTEQHEHVMSHLRFLSHCICSWDPDATARGSHTSPLALKKPTVLESQMLHPFTKQITHNLKFNYPPPLGKQILVANQKNHTFLSHKMLSIPVIRTRNSSSNG